MPINILMPALSPTMEKGNLAKWLKKEGDKVKSGDVIAEIETDKATMEVEAVDEGTIAKILVPEGTQDVAVNDVIAVLAGDGEDVKAAGASAGAAIAAASLMGPAQVAARLFEFGVLKRLHPLVSTRLALLMHPLGAAFLGALGGSAASVFALLHGAGNGLLTISRGTLPLALFGPAGYGLRTGIIVAPARVTTAAAPLLFGLLLDAMGTGALLVSAGLSLAALAALGLLRVQPASASA